MDQEPKTISVQKPKLPNKFREGKRIESDNLYEHLELSELSLTQQKASHAQIEQSRFKSVDLSETGFKFFQLVDVLIINSNIANAKWREANISRVTFTECRLTGFDVADGILENIEFQNCKLNLANFRFAKLKKVRFENCDLQEADFLGAELKSVDFSRCDLSKTQFANTKMNNVDFRTSTIHGLKAQADNLKGAIISPDQALDLIWLLGVKVS